MDCYNATISSGDFAWVWIDTIGILLTLPVTSIFLIKATYQTKNLHKNYRLIIIQICLLFLTRTIYQALTNIYFLYGYHININCYWIVWPSRAFFFIILTAIPFLIMERAFATYLFSKYEKNKYCKCIAYAVIMLQIICPCFLFIDDVEYVQNLACSSHYTLIISLLALCQFSSLPISLFLHKINSRIRKSLKNGEKISGRYQLRENAKTCRSLAVASMGASLWVLLYLCYHFHAAICIKERIAPPWDTLNLLSLQVFIFIIVLPHDQIRRKCLQNTIFQNSVFCNKLLCNFAKNRYRVNNQQGVSSTSQNSHFETLSRQWQTTSGTQGSSQQWQPEASPGSAP